MTGLSQEFKFRDVFNERIIRELSQKISKNYTAFNKKEFISEAIKNFDVLSFGDRNHQICDALYKFLPTDYKKSISILLNSLSPPLNLEGETDWDSFIIMPQCLFVSRYGKDHYDISMNALYEMTQRFSAEGELRTFLELDFKKTMSILTTWTKDPSYHVRRLVSEGTRPRLPLAGRITRFQKDPLPLINLLSLLKEDPSLYVRRSVANNLNDISKDNPKIAIDVLREWNKSKNKDTRWLVKHASRTLLKQGHSDILEIYGYTKNPQIEVDFSINSKEVTLGDFLEMQLTINSESKKKQKLLIDFIVYYMKSNGKLAPKIFKWSDKSLQKNQPISLKKSIIFKPFSTRKQYKGEHKIALQINGKISNTLTFVVI